MTRRFTRLFRIRALLAAIPLGLASHAMAQPSADGVYGQPGFYTSTPGNLDMPASARLWEPRGLAASPEGLYISDQKLNRVLFFPKGSFNATRVYGQPDFNQTVANNGGLNARGLYAPLGVAAHSTGLYVADYYNNRVLFFPTGSTEATRVYGQPDFTTNTSNYGGLSARSLSYPEAVAVDSEGGLFVSDSSNNRVLYFEPGSTTASFVYGQPDFTTNYPGYGPQGMYQTKGVAVDAEGVYVTDYHHERVLFFPKSQKTATRVYGQPGFYSSHPNAEGVGPNSLQQPNGVAVDDEGLYISDYLNSRILFFPKGSNVASMVYGQPDFTAVRLSPNGIDPYHFYVPWNVTADDTHVYGADSYSCRVLRWPKNNSPIPASLAITRQPEGATPGGLLSVQPVVTVRVSTGETAAKYIGTVRVSIASGPTPSCATMGGTVTVNAVAGVASFSDLAISEPGTYRLRVRAASLPAVDSEPFTIAGPGGVIPGDVNNDGQFTAADASLTFKVIAGLAAWPQ